MSTPATTSSHSEPAVVMTRLLARFHLHPEAQLHPSWLPASWPARHRHVERFGVDGQAVLSTILQRRLPDAEGFDTDFAPPRKRLALLDGRDLRMLALYCGFATHRELLRERRVGPPLRRQLQRFGPEAANFVMHRMPELPAFQMNNASLLTRPMGAGRAIWRRGARLLLALVAQDGPAVCERTRLKLPRSLAEGKLPALSPEQLAQLDELVQLSILPERLSSWHWLF
jgi:type III secretion protein K